MIHLDAAYGLAWSLTRDDRNAEDIGGKIVTTEQIEQVNKVLQSLDRYWSNLVSYAR